MMWWKKKNAITDKCSSTVTVKTESDLKEEWLRGFEEGFRSAWNWMVPYMQEAKEEVKKNAYEQAMNKALNDLEPTVRRMEELGYEIR